MVQFISIPLKKSINKSYLKVKPFREDFDLFKNKLTHLLSKINKEESEEHNKNYVRDFLKNTFYGGKEVNTKGRTDLAVHLDKTSKSKVGVIIETKSPANKTDMISATDLNRKSLHEVILYYFRERIDCKNDEIKNIIVTNANEWFIFRAEQFEKLFYKSELKKEYEKWNNNQKVSSNTDFFYEIIKNFLNKEDFSIEGIHFNLSDFEKLKEKDEKKLISLYKIFSPAELLKEPFANDSNTLNKQFYLELLHIIGLEEFKDGSKKTIKRKNEKERDGGSLLENTIRILESEDAVNSLENPGHFGETAEERLFNLALELNITWINRILFLKLLEAQLVNYHKGDQKFKFLVPKVIQEYDDLYELFHEVLAKKTNDRSEDIINKFRNIPYLNSSLFDISELERKTIRISNLKDRFDLKFSHPTVFSKETRSKGEFKALEYLLKFLDAFDFASETGEEIQEERKTIINASVLGLIFEKINGYKEGSFYTPGFITMYMARETLRRAVVQKFNEAKETDYKDYDELKRNIDTSAKGREEANKIINNLKICDPAVGSGHFLVSCLDEIIAIKSDLRILTDRQGRKIVDYSFSIENDELVIMDDEKDELFDYYLNDSGKPLPIKQELQETLFHEKETIIENCLFGVDINPNSVNICRLRLWIELLKHSYYTKESNYSELETLPNIDINIKQGNSLISRFDIKEDVFTPADLKTLEIYKLNVKLYKDEQDKAKRRELKASIEKTKERFRGIAVDPLKKETEQINKLTEQLYDLDKGDMFAGELTEKQKEKIEKKRETLTEKINKLSEEKKEKISEYKSIYAEAFEWRFEFPEVLNDEGDYLGFDVVIGNPPYIRQEMLKEYKENFKLNFESFTSTSDIYTYFYEKGLGVLKKEGLLIFISSSKFFRSNYGKKLRKFILDNCKILNIVDFGELPVFDASTFPTIVYLQCGDNNSNNIISVSKIRELPTTNNLSDIRRVEKFELSQRMLQGNGWVFENETIQKVRNKIKNTGRELKLLLEKGILLGIKTGLNKAFVINEDEYRKLLILDKNLEKILVPYLKGDDIRKYYADFSGEFLILAKKGIDIDNYPLIYEHLKKFKSELSKRTDIKNGGKWFELRSCSYYDEFEKEKIAFPEIGMETRFTLVDGDVYFRNSAHLIPSTDRYLLGLLNSKVSLFFFRLECDVFGEIGEGGRMMFRETYVEKFPVPDIGKKEKTIFINLVDQILEKKKENPDADTTALEKQIDEKVYQLYGLTEEEIKIVEGE